MKTSSSFLRPWAAWGGAGSYRAGGAGDGARPRLRHRDAEWKDEPPTPDYYMHQLDGLPPERELDSDKLAAELNKLLRPPAENKKM